jgi:hypothetical protein
MMKATSFLTSASVLILATLAAPAASAQSAPGYTAPKTAWGVPDFQGYWDNKSVTSLTRPRGVEKLIVTESEATDIVNRNAFQILLQQDRASEGEVGDLQELVDDRNPDRGYNAFWVDPGSQLAKVKGEYRTSHIVEPANGQIPAKAGVSRGRRALAPGHGAFDDPEARGLAERCLMSFTGSAGPVMQNGMYNNTYQIVQTPTYVMIDVEMNHDARIIPIVSGPSEAKFGPDVIKKWAGDSVGWYEGPTLVVKTRNPNPAQNALISDDGMVTERFTRWSDGEIFYEFSVDDPSRYTQTWKGEMALRKSAEPPYEYACHEGNYALAGVLGGARKLESEGRKNVSGPGITAGIEVPARKK